MQAGGQVTPVLAGNLRDLGTVGEALERPRLTCALSASGL